MSREEIARHLRQALLEDGPMAYALYEYELKGEINYWYKGLKRDQESFVFVITENRGQVAMVLIKPDKTVYINEEARKKLQAYWQDNYVPNIERFLPAMVHDISAGYFFETGVKIFKTAKPKKTKGFG
jgi:hypothetical protein